MNFEDLVKAWVLYDNKIRESNKELKILREKRTITDSEILVYPNPTNGIINIITSKEINRLQNTLM